MIEMLKSFPRFLFSISRSCRRSRVCHPPEVPVCQLREGLPFHLPEDLVCPPPKARVFRPDRGRFTPLTRSPSSTSASTNLKMTAWATATMTTFSTTTRWCRRKSNRTWSPSDAAGIASASSSAFFSASWPRSSPLSFFAPSFDSLAECLYSDLLSCTTSPPRCARTIFLSCWTWIAQILAVNLICLKCDSLN